MKKNKTLLTFVALPYSLLIVALILWGIVSVLKLNAVIVTIEYLLLVASSAISIIGTLKAAKLLKSTFTKDQMRLITTAFHVFIATIIIVVTTFVVIRYS